MKNQIFVLFILGVLGFGANGRAAFKDCSSEEAREACFRLPEGIASSDINNPKYRYPSQAFFMRQTQRETRKAAVLVHGLSDSPYTMKDIALTFFREGYDVYAILLAGHGTRPENLHSVHWQDWRRQLDEQIRTLSNGPNAYQKIVLSGFSTGATTVIDYVQNNSNGHAIAGVALFSPAVRIASFSNGLGACTLALTNTYIGNNNLRENQPGQYVRMSYNGPCQLRLFIDQIQVSGNGATLGIPTLTALSEYDTVVDIARMERFALANGPVQNSKNRTIIVRNQNYNDGRLRGRGVTLVEAALPIAHEVLPMHINAFRRQQNAVWGRIENSLRDFIRSLE